LELSIIGGLVMKNKYTVNEEIVAVIAAAIAAFGQRSDRKLIIKKIKRVSQTSPVWNTTGRIERISNRL
jgi:hypothetical protein